MIVGTLIKVSSDPKSETNFTESPEDMAGYHGFGQGDVSENTQRVARGANPVPRCQGYENASSSHRRAWG
jgi:hypothetical protein